MKYSIYLILIIIVAILLWYLFQPHTQIIEERLPLSPERAKNEEIDKTGGEEKVRAVEEIVQNLENLAKEFDNKPPFAVARVWVQSDNFYIEYKNKIGTFAQLLVVKDGENYKGIGYFSPSESGWVLQAGQGELVGADAVLYEQGEGGKWMRKN